MRVTSWVWTLSAFVSLAGCSSNGEGTPPPSPDATPDVPKRDDVASDTVDSATKDDARDAVAEDIKSCDGASGLGQEGCPCSPHGLWQCFGGTGLVCTNGVWRSFFDGPCSPVDAPNLCNEEREAMGCICRIFGQRICVNGQGLRCSDGNGRWGFDPLGSVCEGGSSDADADSDAPSDALTDGDAKNCLDAGGLSKEGCACSTERLYECSNGSGIMCLNGVWIPIIDGPCWARDGDSSCTDEAPGCRCPILLQRICVNGQGLQCGEGNGRWWSDPSACGDSGPPDGDGQTDADGAANDDVASDG